MMIMMCTVMIDRRRAGVESNGNENVGCYSGSRRVARGVDERVDAHIDTANSTENYEGPIAQNRNNADNANKHNNADNDIDRT